jgi:Kinesin motor domain
VPSKINFVDLSGAERGVTEEGNQKTVEEGTQINKSLFALSKCINALTKAGRNIGMVYVPYRDSKLTRFLKDSLGGTTRTTMICHISPSSSRFNESSATLKYAEMAKMIPVLPKESIRQFKELQEQEYRRMVHELRKELDQMKSLNPAGPIIEEMDQVTHGSIPEPKFLSNQTHLMPPIKPVLAGQYQIPQLQVVQDKSKSSAAQPYYSQKDTKHLLSALKQENDVRELLDSESTRNLLSKLTTLLEEEVELKKNLSDLEAHNRMNDVLRKRYKERIARAAGDQDLEWINDVYNELKQSDDHNEYVREMLTKDIKDNKDKVKSFVAHAEREIGQAKAQLVFKDIFRMRDDKLNRVEMETNLRLYENLNKKLLDRVFENGGPGSSSREQAGPVPAAEQDPVFRPRGQEHLETTNEFNLDSSDKRQARGALVVEENKPVRGVAKGREEAEVKSELDRSRKNQDNSGMFDMDADAEQLGSKQYELKGIKDRLKSPSRQRYLADDPKTIMSDSDINLDGTIFNHLVAQNKHEALFIKHPKTQFLAAAQLREDNIKQDATVPRYVGRDTSEGSKSILDKFQRNQARQEQIELARSSDNYLGRLDDPTSASKMLLGPEFSKPRNKSPVANGAKLSSVVISSLPINLHTEAQTILASAGLDEASMQYLSTEPLANPDRETSIKFGIEGEQIVRWNLNVAWGEEFKLYLGGQGYECFPETKSVFEGELMIDENDFLGLLDPKEMNLFESMLPKNGARKANKPEELSKEKENHPEIDKKKGQTKGTQPQRNLLASKEQEPSRPADQRKQEYRTGSTKEVVLPDLRAKSKDKNAFSDSQIMESPDEISSKGKRTGSILDQFLPEAKDKRKIETQSSFEKQISANHNAGGIFSLSQSRQGTQTNFRDLRDKGVSQDKNRQNSEDESAHRHARNGGVKLPKLKEIPQHQLSYNLSVVDSNSEERDQAGKRFSKKGSHDQESMSYKPRGYDAGPNYQEQDDQMPDFDLDDGISGKPVNIHIEVDEIDTREPHNPNHQQLKEFSAAETRKQEQRGFKKQETSEDYSK